MARMIPPILVKNSGTNYTNSIPWGERHIFDLFNKDDKEKGLMKSWVVFHSLKVARHTVNISGELDFVVLIPRFGVLCIEIKGGAVERRNGLWKFPYSKGFEDKSPFRQCEESMFSLQKWLKAQNPVFGKILFFHAVIFTNVDVNVESPEWLPWQNIGMTRLAKSGIYGICQDILLKAHAYFSNQEDVRWYDSHHSKPSIEIVEQMRDILRKEIEIYIRPADILNVVDGEIKKFTEDQFYALDLLADCPRVVFRGHAGTGKTIIAIEAANRAIQMGRKTLLICFNKLLQHWLDAQFSPGKSGVTRPKVCTLHSLLREIAGAKLPDQPDESFWRKELPEAAQDSLLRASELQGVWDIIIVDEAQDILYQQYLDILDLLLKGGLASGRWLMFGDFNHQNIYGGEVLAESLLGHPYHASQGKLGKNCRNTDGITQYIEMLCDIKYIKPGLNINAGQPVMKFYGVSQEHVDQDHQILQDTLLYNLLFSLLDKYEPDMIKVLSMKAADKSTAARMARESGARIKLEALLMSDTTEVGFTSIHSFKGRDAPIVILTDIEDLTSHQSQALLYVGMSRARQQLYMLCHFKCKKQLAQLLKDSRA